MRDPLLGARLTRYREIRALSFDEACAEVAKDGTLIDLDSKISLSPKTWLRSQRVARYLSGPFKVTISEREGRVRSVEVFEKGIWD